MFVTVSAYFLGVKGLAYNFLLFAISSHAGIVKPLHKETDMTAKDLFILHDSTVSALKSIARAQDSSSWGPPAAENPNENWEDPKEYEVLCDDGEIEVISAHSATEAFEQAQEWGMKPVEVFPL